MYCKHCGKEIADDSKFCQHCGGSQFESSAATSTEANTNSPQKEKVLEIPTIKTNFTEKTKWWIIGYGLWVVLNLYWLFAGTKSGDASDYFQPFSEKIDSRYSFYDISEFIVYVIGLPLIIWGIIMYNKKKKENSKKVDTTQQQVSENNNHILMMP